ncbi:MAG: hypothetical protein Q8O59_04635 [bacterium]|nr:hypothetical protein [bacterium]
MKKLRLFLSVMACFFFFVACAPSEEQYRAEIEKHINTNSNKGKALQKAEAEIMRQLAKEDQEKQETEKNKEGGKR